MIVVDASIVVDILCNPGRSDTLRRRLAEEQLLAPDLLVIGVASALRGLDRSGHLGHEALDVAAANLARMPIDFVPTLPLLTDVFRLRQNISAYDAAYVALAALTRCPLLTHDRRLARAAAPHCEIASVSGR